MLFLNVNSLLFIIHALFIIQAFFVLAYRVRVLYINPNTYLY